MGPTVVAGAYRPTMLIFLAKITSSQIRFEGSRFRHGECPLLLAWSTRHMGPDRIFGRVYELEVLVLQLQLAGITRVAPGPPWIMAFGSY